jgi:gamma-glutamylputrescine oxidase
MDSTPRDEAHPHAASFYAANRPRRPLHPLLSGREEAQVCVVGGGLAGLTAALELARRGLGVVLLEAKRAGWGASGRNGGFVSPGFAAGMEAIERRVGLFVAKQLFALSVRGVDYVENEIVQAGANAIINGRGWLYAQRGGKTDALKRRQGRLSREYGARTEFLQGNQLQDLLVTDRYRAAVLDHKAFHMDPLAYAELLLQLCADAGVRIHEGTQVRRIDAKGAAHVLTSEEGQVTSQKVVVATSAYGGPVRQIERSVLPVATYVVTSTAGDPRLADAIRYRGCISDMRRASDYYRLVGEGVNMRLLWGGRITTRRSQPARLSGMLLNDIRDVFPQLSGLAIDYAWSGLMGYVRHKMPLIAEIRPGLYALTGFGGHGLNTTAAGGLVIADAITGNPEDLNLFAGYGAVWGGGPVGRLATQLEYTRLRLMDLLDEL